MPFVGWVAYSAGAAVVVFVGSLLFFRRTEPYFAEAV
jgi:hypothetical protein